MQGYRIFLSHRFGELDRQRADIIERVLKELSPHIEIYNPGTDVTAASSWRDEITKELVQSDMLLLLYADPRQDWAWCTYEAGLFSRIDHDAEELDPIVVIHNQTFDPPSQLAHLQCLEATTARVRHFLEDFLRTTKITRARWPLESRINDEELDAATETICAQFRKVNQFHATYRLELALPLDRCDHDRIPTEARVVSATSNTLPLFGLGEESDCTWGDLVSEHSGAEWLEELDKAFVQCVQRKMPEPNRKTFRPPRSGAIVRPTIYRVDSYDGCPHTVCVIFTLEPAPGMVGGKVFNILRSLERTRTELILRFVDYTEPSDPTLSSSYDLEAIAMASQLIHAEAHEHGVFDASVLERCFPEANTVGCLRAIGECWNRSTKELLEAVAAEDRGAVLDRLLALSGHVDQFAKIASERYAALVSERPERVSVATERLVSAQRGEPPIRLAGADAPSPCARGVSTVGPRSNGSSTDGALPGGGWEARRAR